jgi:hypothetical protein
MYRCSSLLASGAGSNLGLKKLFNSRNMLDVNSQIIGYIAGGDPFVSI